MTDAEPAPEQEVLPAGFSWDYAAIGRGPYASEFPPEQIVQAYLARTPDRARGVNLGCGGATFDGWLNIDNGEPWHPDVLHDLTAGLPMIPAESIDVIYSEHFLEHIHRRDALHLMREASRVLRPGGRVRIAMPDLDQMLENYSRGTHFPADHIEFNDFFEGMFHTRGEWLNIGMRAWGHTYIYNFEDLRLLLKAAGLRSVVRSDWGVSQDANLSGRESRPADQSALIAETAK